MTTPFIIPIEPTKASWVRIEVTTLSPHIGNLTYSLQLSEILVFSGKENVALNQAVIVPTPRKGASPYHSRFLTDGIGPYLMDAADGTRSATQLIRSRRQLSSPTLTIDLNTTHTVNQINLHTAGVDLSIPTVKFSNWAMPRHVRITGAIHPDFSDETLLFENIQSSIYDTGSIIVRRFPKTRCRYIRMTMIDHRPIAYSEAKQIKVGFSEIEVLSESRNVALGKQVSVSPGLFCSPETLTRITDGLNYYGKILPMREWINQLARRHDLAVKRPLIVAELSQRYERQKNNLQILAWVVVLLAAGTIIIILAAKVEKEHAIFQTRESIAAELHDELGANLHAIGLFGDLAKQEASKADDNGRWDKLIQYVEEVRLLTKQAGKTTQYTIKILESKELHQNLAMEMKRTAEHLLTDLKHEISFTNEGILQTLSPKKRHGLFLFHKECLTNIIRHSRATRAVICLTADRKEINLSVYDNGLGIKETHLNTTPASLVRRARLLNAKVFTESPAEGGTRIILKLKPRHSWRPLKEKPNET